MNSCSSRMRCRRSRVRSRSRSSGTRTCRDARSNMLRGTENTRGPKSGRSLGQKLQPFHALPSDTDSMHCEALLEHFRHTSQHGTSRRVLHAVRSVGQMQADNLAPACVQPWWFPGEVSRPSVRKEDHGVNVFLPLSAQVLRLSHKLLHSFPARRVVGP